MSATTFKQSSSVNQLKLDSSGTNADQIYIKKDSYYAYIGISTDGYFYIKSNCFRDDNGNRNRGYLGCGTDSDKTLHVRTS